jgi:hypothetical protein
MELCLKGANGDSITDPTCSGYLAGFIGALRISRTVSDDFPICLPEQGLTNGRVVAELSDFLEKNEAYLQRSARSVVFLVFTNRYPCPDGGPRDQPPTR